MCVFVGNLIQLRLVASDGGQKGETSGPGNILTSDWVSTVGKCPPGCCSENFLINNMFVEIKIMTFSKNLIKKPFVEIKRICSLAGHRINFRICLLEYKKNTFLSTLLVKGLS